MPADDKHYLLNKDNLGELIQMQLTQKQKTFSQFWFAFLKSILNSKHLPKKGDTHSWCISQNTGSKKLAYIMSKKPCFRGPIDREDGKLVETMFQYESQHLYKIDQSLWT